MKSLKVLIANVKLEARTGTELYVRDLALGLLERGHQPVVYSPRLGPLAAEIRRATVNESASRIFKRIRAGPRSCVKRLWNSAGSWST